MDKEETKGDLGSIVGYRQIPKKYKIKIKNKDNYYISCKFGSLSLNKINYIYTSNIVKNDLGKNLKKNNNNINCLTNKNNQYAKILPPDRIFIYFLNKLDMETFERIPSIFTTLEGIMKIKQFIEDYELLKDKSEEEKKFREKMKDF